MRKLRIGEVKKLETAKKWLENALRLKQFKNVTHIPPSSSDTSGLFLPFSDPSWACWSSCPYGSSQRMETRVASAGLLRWMNLDHWFLGWRLFWMRMLAVGEPEASRPEAWWGASHPCIPEPIDSHQSYDIPVRIQIRYSSQMILWKYDYQNVRL